MHTTTFTALLTAAVIFGLLFAVLAIVKACTFTHHHYRITGDEVRDTNANKDRIL